MQTHKNTILTIFLILILILSGFIYCTKKDMDESSGQRVVLLEKFTGTWCGWCPYGAEILEDILEKTGNVVVLAYHTKDSMTIEDTKVLQNAFDPRHPQAVIDRVQYPETEKMPISRGDWDRTVTYRLGAGVPLLISAEGAYDPGSRMVDLDIKFEPGKDFKEGTYKINVVITEDGLKYTQTIFRDPNRNEIPGYVHKHVVREMVTGPWGQVLDKKQIRIEDEDVSVLKDKTISFKLDKKFIAENCHVVVFVHEDLGEGYGPVLQAAELNIKDMTGFIPDNR
ncbi:Omp28-related outer membrane protein [candidate division KSB1 bacterium]